MDFDLIVVVPCFAYFLLWFIAVIRAELADQDLSSWRESHPGVWPAEYERGKELVFHCLRAQLSLRFFPKAENLDEKLGELRSFLKSKERVQNYFSPQN